jgi:predicted metal-dependent hydrolase
VRHRLYPVDALKRRALEWSVRLRVNPRVIRVQPMRHKWGSCSVKGTVTFASDLADKDSRFQDYVLVHELLHLRVRNHGRLFKVLMTAYVPGWRRLSNDVRNVRNQGSGIGNQGWSRK